MKAGIVTIYDPLPNYGNRLQNYAVQEILRGKGLEVETIAGDLPRCSWMSDAKALLHRIGGYRFAREEEYWKKTYPRIRAFDAFNRRYIPTFFCRSPEELKGRDDVYAVGSDQVWNPTWYGERTLKRELYGLTFAKPHQKICISPSFGISSLPEEWKPWFREQLSSFPMLSVREEAGRQIIRELTGREAEVLVDPTMILKREKWEALMKVPVGLDCQRPYAFSYFLGGRPPELESDWKRLQEYGQLREYDLFQSQRPELYAADPCEFLYLIHNAKIILTDSFHGCIFSFLFGKPFLVYERRGSERGLMSRIDTLLGLFGLERKKAGGKLENHLLECDYRKGYHILEEERIKFDQYLEKSLAGVR